MFLLRLLNLPRPALVLGLILVTPVWGQTASAIEQGQALAAEIREQIPADGFVTTGTLRLRDRNGRWWKLLPIRMEVVVGAGSWETVYSTFDNERQLVEVLVVVRTPDGVNRYDYRPPGHEAEAISLTGHQAAIPFAGSQFWLADFGLEFLFWPAQSVLRTEMRKGRSCYVLESLNPDPRPGHYAFVRSWIDVEKRGLLRAEAFDENRRLLKEFNIGSFRKVDGRWQLKSMEIRDELTDERSRLEFDLEFE